MMYDERFVTPMRQELTQLGVEEMRTAQEVDAKLKGAHGTTLVVVNSVCGCAARNGDLGLLLCRREAPPSCREGDPARHEPRHADHRVRRTGCRCRAEGAQL